MTGRALIAGGSIGGLFAAAALLRAGWDVTVFERSTTELSGRGAGIVTHPELIVALQSLGAVTDDLGVAVTDRIAIAQDQSIVHSLPYPQIVTSWERIHQLLRGLIPVGRVRLGQIVTGYDTAQDGVRVQLSDGSVQDADLLVGADGFRSAVRAQMCPEVVPSYSGYVVWRVVTDEADLSPEAHALLFSDFGFYAPYGMQVLGYPIAGPENDLRPGHRRYNFVWYAPVAADMLDDMLTDASGVRHDMTIPPPLVREDVVARLTRQAQSRLPRAFSEILERGERPFFTPIYDHWASRFSDGRVALVGDAACVARPHVGMGVTKAAEDALALAAHVSSGVPVATALRAYSDQRAPESRRAYLKGQALGGLLFDGPSDRNADGRAHPSLERIMRETAVSMAD